MGLFKSSAKRQAEAEVRKAQRQAMIAKAELAARLDAQSAKSEFRKALRQERKQAEKARKAELKSEKVAAKSAVKSEKIAAKSAAETNKAKITVAELNAQAAADGTVFNAKRVRRYLSVAKLVSPVLVPVAYRAATAARTQLDNFQANRSGLSPADIAKFDGYGARLSARIDRSRTALATLTADNSDAETTAFADAMRGRLNNLSEAVQSSETMPASRRRAAHQAIGRELSAIEADILARRGVRA